ncbi:MAG: hypothetical protein IJV00_07140 [Clostridia bacterium]|nr:hypothetical protein [Clostridia bacterium]
MFNNNDERTAFFDAVEKLIEVDQDFALRIKEWLERRVFANEIVAAFFSCCILPLDPMNVRIGLQISWRVSVPESAIDVDTEKMLCTIRLNDVTTARVRIVDERGLKSIFAGPYGGPHREAEPIPTPESELAAMRDRPADKAALDEARSRMKKAARRVGGAFLDRLNGRYFYARVRTKEGEVKELSPELIEKYLEREYVYVDKKDVEVDMIHHLVKIGKWVNVSVTELTGDEKVLCEVPKRGKKQIPPDTRTAERARPL